VKSALSNVGAVVEQVCVLGEGKGSEDWDGGRGEGGAHTHAWVCRARRKFYKSPVNPQKSRQRSLYIYERALQMRERALYMRRRAL